MKWDKLPILSRARFEWHNSGKKLNLAPPYWIDEDGSLRTYISGAFNPIGRTFDPPFKAGWESGGARCVAIMYEWSVAGDNDPSEVWWHHLLEET